MLQFPTTALRFARRELFGPSQKPALRAFALQLVADPFFVSGLVKANPAMLGFPAFPTHMNALILGTADKTQLLLDLAQRPFLLIDDGPIATAFLHEFPKAAVFDINSHTFNPLSRIDDKTAREFAATLYGEKDLMTYRDGKRALVEMVLEGDRLDRLPVIKHKGYEEARDTVADLLLSPILRRVLCPPKGNFSFKGPNRTYNRTIIAVLNRAEIGDFVAYILGSLLITRYNGHVVIPDFGFYGRPSHISLIRQRRLLAGVDHLGQLPEGFDLNHFSEHIPSRALRRDAIELAEHRGLTPDPTRADNDYNRFIKEATSPH